jgi:hypothetical protein
MQFTPLTEKEAQESRLVPKGDYFFTVTKAEDKDYNGNSFMDLTLECLMPDGSKRLVFPKIYDSRQFRQFCEATDMLDKYETGSVPASETVQKTGKCHVDIRPSQPKKDHPGEFWAPKNVVKQWYKRGEASVQDNSFINEDIPF